MVEMYDINKTKTKLGSVDGFCHLPNMIVLVCVCASDAIHNCTKYLYELWWLLDLVLVNKIVFLQKKQTNIYIYINI